MNSLELSLRSKTAVVPDKQYRLLVTLIRSDRPRYWKFKCFNDECSGKIVDLQNLEVIGIDDFYDPQNLNNYGIAVHCKGTLPNGLPCCYSYVFHVQ